MVHKFSCVKPLFSSVSMPTNLNHECKQKNKNMGANKTSKAK